MSESKNKTGIARLLQLAGQKKILIIVGCALGAIATILQFFPAILSYQAMMHVAECLMNNLTYDKGYLTKLAMEAILCFVGYAILFNLGSICAHVAAFDILYGLRIKISEKLSKLGMGYFASHSSGSVKQVMNDDVENIEKFIAHHTIDIVSAVSVLVVSIITMCAIDIRLAIAAIIPSFFGIMLYVKSYASPENARLTKEYYKEISAMSATTVEYVNGMPVLKVFGQAGSSLKRLEHDIIAHGKALREWSNSFNKPFSGFSTAIACPLTVIVPVGVVISFSTDSIELFIPKFFFFLLVGVSMNLPLNKLMFLVSMMQKNIEGIRHVDNILYAEEIPEAKNEEQPKDNSITFRNVCFGYEEEEVLHNVSFSIKEGETIGLVGPSGGGKSTIAQLIARFWDVRKGEILIGGIDIRNITSETLMQTVAFVFQDIYMFHDTIENNIKMGKEATREEVMEAAKAAQIHDFICSLPDGYDTMLGEGTQLSGGEQQRVSIARAILKDAPIIILDEATAYADAENEAKIQDAFSELTKGKTVLVIAHRLSTITGADRILAVENGYLKESGTHEELLQKGGLYSRIYEAYSRSEVWKLREQKGEL